MKQLSPEKQMVKDTLDSGISPIVFDYQDVVFFQKEHHIIRTFMVFNSLDVGTLTYKEYRFVARRTRQGFQMVKRHVEKLLRLIPKFTAKYPQIECFTLPVFPRLVRDGELAGILYDAFALYPNVHPSMLCVEISADILYEDTETVQARLEEIRALGVKIAFCEVGDEFCPVFKLASMPLDMILLDPYTTNMLDKDEGERVAGSLIKYLRTFGVPVIAPELDNEEKIDAAKAFECDGYSVSSEATASDPLPEEAAEAEEAEETEAVEETSETPETAPETVETVETVETAETVETVETVEAVEVVETATEPAEPANETAATAADDSDFDIE